jgi:hypothetical protein
LVGLRHKGTSMAKQPLPDRDLRYIETLDDLEDAWRVMRNAKIHQLKHPEGDPLHGFGLKAWDLAFAKMCKLTADKFEPRDDAERDCLVALAAYEWVLFEKNGKRTYARRIRNSIALNGIKITIAKAVMRGAISSGLKTLVEHDKVGFAFENIVLKYETQFKEIDERLIDKSIEALKKTLSVKHRLVGPEIVLSEVGHAKQNPV